MYVKVTNGNVDTYPYSVGQLRRDNPNTSFPKQISAEVLSSYGVESVVLASEPSFTQRTQVLSQDAQPSLVEGVWTLGWTVTDKTSEEVVEYDANEKMRIRLERDVLLSETDWWVLPDRTATQAQLDYRQALRDITDQAGFPHDITWPVKPEG